MFWKLFSFEYYFLQYKHFLLVETFHITGGGAACNINVWFHCLVAAVTSPLHDYIWRNTASEGSTDECAATFAQLHLRKVRRKSICLPTAPSKIFPIIILNYT